MLFGALFFVAICAASVLLNVFLYTDKSLETLRIEYQSTVRINEMSSFEKVMPNFDKEKFLPYIDNPYVERVSFINYRFSTALIKGTEYTSPDYKMPAEILAKDPNAKPVLPPYLSVELRTKSGIKSLNDFFYNPVYVIGLSFEELNPSNKKEFVLSTGRMYENDNECIIAVSSKISNEEWNLLDVGDIIAMRTDENTYKEFTVVGVLRDNLSLEEGDQTRVLFTTFDSAVFFQGSINASGVLSSSGAMPNARSGKVNSPIDFYSFHKYTINGVENEMVEGYEVLVNLKSNEYFSQLMSEASKNGHTVMFAYSDYRIMIQMLNNSWGWSIAFMIIVAIFIISITMIATIMILNNRKYEIAVLRSVGMKKSRLVVSYLAENLVFIWGIAIVSLTSAQAIYYLFLAQKITANVDMKFMPDSPWSILLQNITLTAGGITVVSVLSLVFAAIYIVGFEPLKIFNKRH